MEELILNYGITVLALNQKNKRIIDLKMSNSCLTVL